MTRPLPRPPTPGAAGGAPSPGRCPPRRPVRRAGRPSGRGRRTTRCDASRRPDSCAAATAEPAVPGRAAREAGPRLSTGTVRRGGGASARRWKRGPRSRAGPHRRRRRPQPGSPRGRHRVPAPLRGVLQRVEHRFQPHHEVEERQPSGSRCRASAPGVLERRPRRVHRRARAPPGGRGVAPWRHGRGTAGRVREGGDRPEGGRDRTLLGRVGPDEPARHGGQPGHGRADGDAAGPGHRLRETHRGQEGGQCRDQDDEVAARSAQMEGVDEQGGAARHDGEHRRHRPDVSRDQRTLLHRRASASRPARERGGPDRFAVNVTTKPAQSSPRTGQGDRASGAGPNG